MKNFLNKDFHPSPNPSAAAPMVPMSVYNQNHMIVTETSNKKISKPLPPIPTDPHPDVKTEPGQPVIIDGQLFQSPPSSQPRPSKPAPSRKTNDSVLIDLTTPTKPTRPPPVDPTFTDFAENRAAAAEGNFKILSSSYFLQK